MCVTKRLHFHFSLSCIGEGNGNPLQCSSLENPRDGVTQSRTRLKWLSSSSSSSNACVCVCMCVCLYVCVCVCVCTCLEVYQAPVYGIFQTRILEWVAISYSRGSSQVRDWTHVFCNSSIGRQILYHWATREALWMSFLEKVYLIPLVIIKKTIPSKYRWRCG